MSHKIVHWRYYLYNAIVITILMAATVAAAKFPMFHLSDNPNGLNLLVAIVIAVMKAACIVLVFMGAWWSSGLVRLFAAGGFVWLCIFFLFTFTDYGFANPVEQYGTPYGDIRSPGNNPEPGGQDFSTHGVEEAPAHGGTYVPPPHLFGGGEGHGAGAVEAVGHEGEPEAAPGGGVEHH